MLMMMMMTIMTISQVGEILFLRCNIYIVDVFCPFMYVYSIHHHIYKILLYIYISFRDQGCYMFLFEGGYTQTIDV